MSLDPKKFREYVLQILYAHNINSQGIDLEGIMNILKVSKKLGSSLIAYAKQVINKSEIIDKIIVVHSKEWSLDRISLLERQILRFGLFELEKKELEKAVIIAEMIRLCKKFSTEASSQYIHAILESSIKTTCGNSGDD